jgi:hypothetical protein
VREASRTVAAQGCRIIPTRAASSPDQSELRKNLLPAGNTTAVARLQRGLLPLRRGTYDGAIRKISPQLFAQFSPFPEAKWAKPHDWRAVTHCRRKGLQTALRRRTQGTREAGYVGV